MDLNNAVLTESWATVLKNKQIKMLKMFIGVCNVLDLKYYVLGGTALGTIRHNGFIPWDDDIDIGMPREDYEIFLTEGQPLFSENYFLQSIFSDPNYPHSFAKIRDSATTFIEQNVKHIHMNHGVYIDIFPLDGVAKTRFKRVYFDLLNKAYSVKINTILDYSMSNKKSSLKGKVFKTLALFFMKHLTVKEVLILRDKLYKKYRLNSSEMIANYCGAWGKREIVSKSTFGNGLIKQFEKLNVIVPENFDAYLTSLYDNYMELPPLDKRKPRHYCSVIDLENSYIHYIK